MQDTQNTPWHSVTLEAVFKRLDAGSKGLDEQDVREIPDRHVRESGQQRF